MAAFNKIFSTMVFYLIFIAASAYGNVIFVEHLIDDQSYGNPSLVACDIDDDGDQDIVGAVMEAGDVVWWRNDGGNPISWQKPPSSLSAWGALTSLTSTRAARYGALCPRAPARP